MKKKKSSTTKKGLESCRHVAKILERAGHLVEGPLFTVAYLGRNFMKVHKDLFGVYDLLSVKGNKKFLHQVTSLNMKSKRYKKIKKKGISGFLWCRFEEGNKELYKLFLIDCKEDKVIEKGVFAYEKEDQIS